MFGSRLNLVLNLAQNGIAGMHAIMLLLKPWQENRCVSHKWGMLCLVRTVNFTRCKPNTQYSEAHCCQNWHAVARMKLRQGQPRVTRSVF